MTAVVNVGNLQMVRKLGEGRFGQVWLAEDRERPQRSGCRQAHCIAHEQRSFLRKEALVQRLVHNNANVLKYISMLVDDEDQFQLFLEYADGGELFDQIEPEVGMSPATAYITPSSSDIKSENLLLSSNGVLKISDFGMATLFRYDGRERELSTVCGTMPYSAPEVYGGRYSGPPVDVCSAGVVLVALLTGQLPWESKDDFRNIPYEECELYHNWVHVRDFSRRPWSHIGAQELSLLEAMLCLCVQDLATIVRVQTHPCLSAYAYEHPQGENDVETKTFIVVVAMGTNGVVSWSPGVNAGRSHSKTLRMAYPDFNDVT